MPEVCLFVNVADPALLKPWGDEDDTEYNHRAGPFADAVRGLSYSTSWSDAATTAARAAGHGSVTAVLALFDAPDDLPYRAGDPLGPGVCIGRFDYQPRATSRVVADNLEASLQRLVVDSEAETLRPALRDALLGDWVVEPADPSRRLADLPIARAAAQRFAALPPSVRSELRTRHQNGQAITVGAFHRLHSSHVTAWFARGVLVGLQASAEDLELPTDRRYLLPELLQPSGIDGAQVGTAVGNRVIDTAAVADWRAVLDAVRASWSPGDRWRIVVLFGARDDALALKRERLRRPSVTALYRHPTGVYAP